MGRFHGRRGRVYFAITSGAEASALPFIAQWEVNHATEKTEVTAMGDRLKVYVGGIPEASGSFSGFLDDATAQTYTAAVDGLARKFYLYPDLSSNTKYWYGTILADMSASGGVSGAGTLASNWAAADDIHRSW